LTRRAFLYFFSGLICFYSCTDNEPSSIRDVNPDAIFFDYKIKGEEGDNNVTVYLQYKRGSHNGVPFVLSEPAKVELDGELVSRDSAKLTGAFYEIQKPASDFSGTHTIVFTDPNNREHQEEFVFQPFKLKTRIPAVINRGEIVFELDGLEPRDHLRVSLTDTAFMSHDINEIDTLQNGKLIISADKLKNVVDGPVTLQLYKEVDSPLKHGTRAGGRIIVSYGMRRVFELKTPAP